MKTVPTKFGDIEIVTCENLPRGEQVYLLGPEQVALLTAKCSCRPCTERREEQES